MAVVTVGALVCACMPLPAQVGDSLTIAERAEVLNTILAPELGLVLRPVEVEPCSILLALGRDPQFTELLKPQVRSRFAGSVSDSCRGSRDITRKTPSGWILREVKRQGGERVSVLATVWHRVGHNRETVHSAEYTLTRRASFDKTPFWGIDQVRLYDFAFYVYD
jgi:hypothetical protein